MPKTLDNRFRFWYYIHMDKYDVVNLRVGFLGVDSEENRSRDYSPQIEQVELNEVENSIHNWFVKKDFGFAHTNAYLISFTCEPST